MKIGLILFDYDENTNLEVYDYLIGVDKGAYNAFKDGIKLDYAIGDFDSITLNQLTELSQSIKIKKLNPIKDLTDTEEALDYAMSLSNDITILGGIDGNRIEHLIANLNLFNKCNHLQIINKYSKIFILDKSYTIKDDEYKFYSFFWYEGSPCISLKGFKYELNNYLLAPHDSLCISNEIIDNGSIDIKNGKILVIQTKNDQN